MTLCNATHPNTGDPCVKPGTHTAHADPAVQQHVTATGLKWPTLHQLNPAEGYNGTQSFRN